jgi:hypothetical protein
MSLKRLNFRTILTLSVSCVGLICAGAPPAFAQEGPVAMFDLFPMSSAPTRLSKPSEFVVSKQYSPRQHFPSRWIEGVEERLVFHAYLMHQSTGERSWELRIGRGGQIYSLVSSFGEAMPPQRLMSPFNDETWQMVLFSDETVDYDLEKGPGSIRDEVNSFVHQSGLYVGRKQQHTPDKPFYCPLLASRWDQEARTYTMINWGLCPTISVNRSDVIFVVQLRDMGGGVIELNHLCYNFGTFTYQACATMWGGVRTSVFPELVLSNPDGTYRFHTPFNLQARDAYTNVIDSGGWAAATQNASNPFSYALGVIFGRDPYWIEQRKLKHTGQMHWQRSATVYGAGDSRGGERDYTVINMDNRVNIAPGECFFRRTYMAIGTLQEVAEAGKELEPFTDLHPVEFKEDETPLLPLYIKRDDKATAQPTLEEPEPGAQPVCQLYSKPVRHSKPVFLLQDGGSGEYILTTDPALQCRKLQFVNPYPADHSKHATLENRHQYLTHQTRTKSWQLLGYAIPADHAATNLAHRKISELPDLAPLFQAGECAQADRLLVR